MAVNFLRGMKGVYRLVNKQGVVCDGVIVYDVIDDVANGFDYKEHNCWLEEQEIDFNNVVFNRAVLSTTIGKSQKLTLKENFMQQSFFDVRLLDYRAKDLWDAGHYYACALLITLKVGKFAIVRGLDTGDTIIYDDIHALVNQLYVNMVSIKHHIDNLTDTEDWMMKVVKLNRSYSVEGNKIENFNSKELQGIGEEMLVIKPDTCAPQLQRLFGTPNRDSYAEVKRICNSKEWQFLLRFAHYGGIAGMVEEYGASRATISKYINNIRAKVKERSHLAVSDDVYFYYDLNKTRKHTGQKKVEKYTRDIEAVLEKRVEALNNAFSNYKYKTIESFIVVEYNLGDSIDSLKAYGKSDEDWSNDGEDVAYNLDEESTGASDSVISLQSNHIEDDLNEDEADKLDTMDEDYYEYIYNSEEGGLEN